jgi:CBS-domain-containing membrane protein
MSDPVVTVNEDAPLSEVLATMEKHQIRRVPVVNEEGCCAGMISQSDVAWTAKPGDVATLMREVSRETGVPSK